ncbi:hypothetical protein JZU69_01540, partial [bacterium]|nr:hypothetical protein [bacterium]
RQGVLTVSELTAALSALWQDLPDFPVYYRKLFFIAMLNEPTRGLVRLEHQKDKKLDISVLEHRAIAAGDATLSASRRSAGSRSTGARPSGSNSHGPAGPPGALHKGDWLLGKGKFTAYQGWTPTPADFHATTADNANPNAARLRGFLQLNNLCFKCRCPGHRRDTCDGPFWVSADGKDLSKV